MPNGNEIGGGREITSWDELCRMDVRGEELELGKGKKRSGLD